MASREKAGDSGWSVDAELEQFIRTPVVSLWGLETLLLLRRSPALAWTADAVAAELRSSPQLCGNILERLTVAGLLVRSDTGFSYQPASAASEDLARRLERAYRYSPIAVRRAIAAGHAERSRGADRPHDRESR